MLDNPTSMAIDVPRGEVLETLDGLFSRRQFLFKKDLEQVKRAALKLFGTLKPLPIVTIAGTNGKGTTTGVLWHLLSSSLKAGLFISPHLCHYFERIQCSHHSVRDPELVEELQIICQHLGHDLYEQLSFFEITLLLALWIFKKHGCDVAVLEVGLGGRLDACNAFEPVATAITSISFDHQNILGNNLEEILLEKLGITRPGVPLFCSANLQSSRLWPLIQHYCAEHGVALQHERNILHLDRSHWATAAGRAREDNFWLAWGLFQFFEGSVPSPSLGGNFAREFPNPKLPWSYSCLGRMQPLKVVSTTSSQNFFLDVSHNIASIRELTQQKGSQGLPALVSILADKDVAEMLDLLVAHFHPVVLFQIPSPRSFSADNLPPHLKQLPFHQTFAAALEDILGHNSNPREIVVSGSVIAVGEVIRYFDAFPKSPYYDPLLLGRYPAP